MLNLIIMESNLKEVTLRNLFIKEAVIALLMDQNMAFVKKGQEVRTIDFKRIIVLVHRDH